MSNRQSHVASFTARVKAMYSVTVDDNATVGCFFEPQLTGSLLSMKMKPATLFVVYPIRI